MTRKQRTKSQTSSHRKRNLGLLAFLIAGSVGWLWHSLHQTGSAEASRVTVSKSEFGPTMVNSKAAPSDPPAGMAWIPGSEFSMGANDPPNMDEVGMKATVDARPIHRVYVDGFFMDKTDVTNAGSRSL